MEIGKKSLKKTMEIKNISGKMDLMIDNFGKSLNGFIENVPWHITPDYLVPTLGHFTTLSSLDQIRLKLSLSPLQLQKLQNERPELSFMTGCKEHHLDVSNLDVDCSDKEVEEKNKDNIVHANNTDSTGLIEQQEHSGTKADKEEEVEEEEEGEENITDSADQDQKMSLKEIRNQMPVTVFRSKSFAGMANARPRSAPGTPVLGETLRRSPRVYTQTPQRSKRLGLGSYKPPKIPKLPQPSRAVLMFESVKKGIKEFIMATQDDIIQLKSRDTNTSTAQGKLHEADKQIKAAERYLKRLEFHLSKIDELQDCYIVNQQLREGARNMARAYANTPGYKKGSLTSVKYGFKECSQTMCAIEAQLESMMGTFHCKLKGMAGFARLCAGDVFEVTMRYGTQKWKAKGKIEKDGSQRWDLPDFVFKTLVGDIISLKAVELRSLKSVLLGEKKCETKDLFSANPQMMTVSINPNGSLKLSIIVTWNPLEGVDESLIIYEVPQRTQDTPRRRPVSALAVNGQYSQLFGSQLDLLGHERRYSSPVSLPQSKDDSYILSSSSSSLSLAATAYPMNDSDSAIYISQLPQRSASRSMLTGSAMALPPPLTTTGHYPSGLAQHAVCAYATDASNLEDALNCLSVSLEDVRGRYQELQKIEELVDVLRCLLKKHSRSSSCSSNISVSIEHALEAFDFLNTEDIVDDVDSSPSESRRSSLDHILTSPESTAKTTDSGIESLAKRLCEDTQLSSSTNSSPLPPSSGNEHVDQALIFHLNYCNKLIENLGSFGPLKCKEIYALDKLQKQSQILENLIHLAKAGSEIDLHSVLGEHLNDKQLKEFWVQCVDRNVLVVPAEKLITMMEQKLVNRFQEPCDVKPTRVFCHLVSRILDISDAELKMTQNLYITLFQFSLFFRNEGFTLVDKIIEEISISDKLCSGNAEIAINCIERLHGSVAPAFCLKVLGTLLICDNQDIRQATASYLRNLQQSRLSRDKSLVVYVEALEDQTAEVRAGAAVALSLLRATESIQQLVFLCQTDSSSLVKVYLKDALFSLGKEGIKAFEETQLGCHGFQGVHVQK
ncbi:rho family-interacting cell polarization regulator 2 isoform X1 [Octopus sinensis]|uniref:Rho family-interacting cell polarization regulator 2 isoform X1 n=2 Tax=Octopus sinensis TaxID=2607531 RepID=A0A7E6F8P3_9MOLL|nr:rho family-interacting cell polarization regulator 2 isoform X1 [Octopus sinensis]